MISKRLKMLATTALAITALGSLPRAANAQEIQLTGPLAGAPSHKKLRQYRKGRFEVAPTASFTLLDEYRRTILIGGKLQYNITDWLGVGVWGAFGAVSMTTNLTDQITETDKKRAASSRTAINVGRKGGGFEDQTAKMQWVAAPQVQLVPFRGKLALFQKLFIDTDAYIHGGLAFVGLQERGDCGSSGTPCTNQDTFALQSRMAIAPTFGLGLNFYPSNFISFGFEYRALPFSWNRAGFDNKGGAPDGKFPDNQITSDDRTFKFNQMVSVHIGFSFPTKPKLSN